MARIRRELRQVTQSQEHGGPGDEVEEPEIGDLDGFTVGVSELIVTLSNYIDKLRARSEVKADPEEIAARDKHIAELEAKIEGLEKELIALKSKVGQQNHVLDVVTSADFIKGSAENALNASISEMTLEEMEIERKALKREKEQLEEERKRFTEAAIELGNERKVLKKEREAFESHKVHSATHQVLSALPDTPQWLKNADVNQDASTPQLYSKLQDLMLATPLGALYTAQMNTLLRHQALQQSPATAAIFQSPLSQNGSAPARASETPLLATAKDEGPSPFHDVATQESPPEDAHDNPDTAKQHHEQPPPPLLHSPRKSDKGQSNDGGRGSAADGTPGSAPRLITAERARIAVLRKGPDSAGGSPRAESRRTPLEIRQGRAGRLCTRPGCAAHSPHTHEDENGNVRPMELKPPVPRFRKAAASPPASPAFAPRTSSRLGVSSGTAPAQLQSKRPTSVLARYASMADRRDPISRSKTPLLRSPTSRQNLEAATKD
ncbi:hypothetical protein EV182_004903 [Spiromyces aspiralis]|uniref:Uncharacterized protein n=1 Tax=Spiromyces aspiralis TaxID=68401 RepID=A0ACC1HD19_9FUNG|nr:hypothetical protein EV182_004903 [Spiromyces aspiralis]